MVHKEHSWSNAENEIVRLGYERGDPVAQIAETLGRTKGAVTQHARVALGLRHGPLTRTLRQRLEEYYIPEPNSGCWLWFGSCDRKGYGQIRFSRSVLRYATHISLELDGRPVPTGMQACHRCDVPACVNPAHLFVGTAANNTADMMQKGRFKKPPPSEVGRGAKAFCKQGHRLSEDNIFMWRGRRHGCLACRLLYKRKWRASKTAGRA